VSILLLALLVAVGSFFAGLLGALTGLGGGIVVVPMLTVLFHVDLRYAIGASLASVPSRVTWNVVEPVRLASLDRRFAMSVAPWPEIPASLMDRIVQRSRWLAFQLAVCHVVRVDTRLLLMLWHFADRWGRMTREGARVNLPVTHSVLASVVGARRPSVTTALGRLQDQGLIERLADGAWLLHGSPPEDFARFEAEAAAYPGSA
jgi:hypothetical protein